MTLTSSSNSRDSGGQSSTTFDELHNMINLQQLQYRNLKLAELLLDSLRNNIHENKRAQKEQKNLVNAVQSSKELDTQAKDCILQNLETLKYRSMFSDSCLFWPYQIAQTLWSDDDCNVTKVVCCVGLEISVPPLRT
ncbi:hypothetical protein R1sor_020525 [Riccia sorocarpa]|uniref:Uncharacterized protein n=1 Tax=Riccia sorocarpa TaxID=122646 RepID=A0ABD3IFK4_9MARC